MHRFEAVILTGLMMTVVPCLVQAEQQAGGDLRAATQNPISSLNVSQTLVEPFVNYNLEGGWSNR